MFYVSWLGADPRDGSAREPSALVSELLAAAAAYHVDPQAAARDLVLQHTLQPFSPAAFGAGDARFFSYRRQWHPAAGGLSGARAPLPPPSLPPPPPAPIAAYRASRENRADPASRLGSGAPRVELRLGSRVQGSSGSFFSTTTKFLTRHSPSDVPARGTGITDCARGQNQCW